MTDAEKHLKTLDHIARENICWMDNSDVTEAAKWALSEIERLTTEIKDRKSQIEYERKQWKKKR
jgi:hypothetical protein